MNHKKIFLRFISRRNFNVTLAATLGLVAAALVPASTQSSAKFRVLLYDKNPPGAYLHTSAISAFKDSLLAWGKEYSFTVDTAADATVFTAANLAKYQTVVFDNVSSEGTAALPQASQKSALLDYMKSGGFVGIHAAAEASSWPDLVSLLGAKMTIHTSETNELSATLNLDAGSAGHPAVTGTSATGKPISLPAQAVLTDEWYSYTASPRSVSGVHILYTLDEKTFTPAAVMGDHPIAWARDMSAGGRMFYTGMGHSAPYLKQSFVRSLLINAIFWTAKMDAAGLARTAARRESQNSPRMHFDPLRTGSRLMISMPSRDGKHALVRALDGRFAGITCVETISREAAACE